MRTKWNVGSRKPEVKKTRPSDFRLLTSYFILSSHFLLSLPAIAADAPIAVEPAAITPPVRLGKPMPTVWDVTKYQPGLLEGKLEFRVHLGPKLFYTYTTDELVLHAPDQRLRLLFPAISEAVSTAELEVDVAWLGKSGRIPLRMQLLRVPFSAQKTTMLMVGEERGAHGRTPEWEQRLSSLAVESLATDATRARVANRDAFLPLQTVIQSWDANSFPQEPLAYTPYDLVAVTGEVFGELRKQQLEAIETWVRAGGRLYIEADDLLEARHVEFLNRLTAHDAQQDNWSLDRVGRLDWPVFNDDDEYHAVVDLGRVVIRHPLSDAIEVSDTARRLLWDVPPGVDPVEQVMKLPMQMPSYGGARRRFTGVIPPGAFLQNQPSVPSLFENLQKLLMPAGVQLVPFWLIVLLLGGLVVTIGPGEWWLLGKLRLRRFTWLTWPAATVAVTALTVGLSNSYMRSAEQSRFLQITDLGTDGRVVRLQRFEMTFPTQSRDVAADVQRGLWRVVTPPEMVDSAPFMLPNPGRRPRGQPQPNLPTPPEADASLAPPTFDGRVPNRYTATQFVPQWTPRLSHRYELPGEDRDGPLDWTTILPLLSGDLRFNLSSALAEVKRQLPEALSITVVHRSDVIGTYLGQGDERPSLWSLVGVLTCQQAAYGTDPWTNTSDRFDWSDLPILSAEGPYDYAVLVVVRDGDGWTVYRRPFRTTTPVLAPGQ